MPTSEVQSVVVQVRPCSEREPAGVVTYGYFTVDADNVLTMTGSDGVPVRDPVSGEMWTHKLEPGEDARHVARRLTLKVRRALRGETEAQERFRGPLKLPDLGIV
jgi:hypothetical protein